MATTKRQVARDTGATVAASRERAADASGCLVAESRGAITLINMKKVQGSTAGFLYWRARGGRQVHDPDP